MNFIYFVMQLKFVIYAYWLIPFCCGNEFKYSIFKSFYIICRLKNGPKIIVYNTKNEWNFLIFTFDVIISRIISKLNIILLWILDNELVKHYRFNQSVSTYSRFDQRICKKLNSNYNISSWQPSFVFSDFTLLISSLKA